MKLSHQSPHSRTQRFSALALLCVLALRPHGVSAQDADVRALQEQLQQVQAMVRQLADENRALRQHQEELDRRVANLTAGGSALPAPAAPAPVAPAAASAAANSSALPQSAPPAAAAAGGSSGSALGNGLRLWGYGEIYYTHPTRDPSEAQFDLARAVFGIGYAFDERTEFNSEYEVEHAVSSASDVGEFEVEQFYLDRHLNDAVTVRAGLFLMPFGFINEHHEPTNFYGVQRNFVETLIIPSTWREGGFNLHGDTAAGFAWNVGLTTGFDFSKWEFAPPSPPYSNALELENSGIAPLQATHQELALANAHHLSQYLALGYYGVPGLTLGAAVSTGQAVAAPLPAGSAGADPRVTLWEGHARWMPGRWDLSALYARGTVSNTAAANAANPGVPNPIPSAFDGYYLQGAYGLWQGGDYRLNPFVRFEHYDMGASYQGTGGPVFSAEPWPVNHDRVWTAGANFYVGPHVVLKGDYQWFEQNPGFNRFDLGLGVSF